MGAMGALLFALLFSYCVNAASRKLPRAIGGNSLNICYVTRSWIILGVVILLLMCGYVIRGSVLPLIAPSII